jgi:hypothetical protein
LLHVYPNGQKVEECNGNIECLESCKKELLEDPGKIFPYSNDIELEVDKVNHLISSMFFLPNRLAKATIGLAELDKSLENVKQLDNLSFEKNENNEVYNKFVVELNEYWINISNNKIFYFTILLVIRFFHYFLLLIFLFRCKLTK